MKSQNAATYFSYGQQNGGGGSDRLFISGYYGNENALSVRILHHQPVGACSTYGHLSIPTLPVSILVLITLCCSLGHFSPVRLLIFRVV